MASGRAVRARPAGPVSIQEAGFQLSRCLPGWPGGLVQRAFLWSYLHLRQHRHICQLEQGRGRADRNSQCGHRLRYLQDQLRVGATMRAGHLVMFRRFGLVAGMAGGHSVRHLHRGGRHHLRHGTGAERLLRSQEQGKTCQKERAEQGHLYCRFGRCGCTDPDLDHIHDAPRAQSKPGQLLICRARPPRVRGPQRGALV